MKLPRTIIVSVIVWSAVRVADATPSTPEAQNVITLVTIHSNADVLNAAALQEGEQHQIHGYALRRSLNATAGRGQIDFEVFSPTGESMLVQQVALLPTPMPRGAHGHSTFFWRIPAEVTHASRIEMRYHTDTHRSVPSRETGS